LGPRTLSGRSRPPTGSASLETMPAQAPVRRGEGCVLACAGSKAPLIRPFGAPSPRERGEGIEQERPSASGEKGVVAGEQARSYNSWSVAGGGGVDCRGHGCPRRVSAHGRAARGRPHPRLPRSPGRPLTAPDRSPRRKSPAEKSADGGAGVAEHAQPGGVFGP